MRFAWPPRELANRERSVRAGQSLRREPGLELRLVEPFVGAHVDHIARLGHRYPLAAGAFRRTTPAGAGVASKPNKFA